MQKEDLINAVKALQLPTDKLKAVLMNIIANDNTLSLLTCRDITHLRSFLMTIRNSKEDSESCTNNDTICLWTISSRASLPDKAVQIHLMFTFEKSETDKLEDEKVEQLILEYHRLKRPTILLSKAIKAKHLK